MSQTTIDAPPVARTGIAPVRLIKAELLKIRTTNSWWIFGVISLAFTALALLITILQANSEISFAVEQANQPMPDFLPRNPDGTPMSPEEAGVTPQQIEGWRQEYLASIDVARIVIRSAANVFTAGQFFGLLLVVVLGALVVTNEFFHQTATTTFLTTPRRTSVILSKLAAASGIAVVFWLVTTVIDLAAGSIYFSSEGYDIPLGEWPVVRSVLMNLLAYVIWAVLGVGLGVLIRSQLGATLTAAVFYLLAFPVALILFNLIYAFVIKKDWVWNYIVAIPGVASTIMISPERVQFSASENGPIYGPEWWTGALILLAYGVGAAVIGTLITRKRDIS